MEVDKVVEVVVKKCPEHQLVDKRIRTLKYLIELGDNELEESTRKKEAFRFLHEVWCFREEFGDDHIVPELREAVRKNEEFLTIQEKTTYKEEPARWLIDGLIPPPKYRDNDEMRCREIFNEKELCWQPLLDYDTRERFACHYCKCTECDWEYRNIEFGCLGMPRINQPLASRKTPQSSEPCTKHKFYLPFVERDDDEGRGGIWPSSNVQSFMATFGLSVKTPDQEL